VSLRDAFATGLRLAGASGGLVWDAAFGDRGIPRGVEDLDAAWLGRALAARFPGIRVDAVRRVDAHSGTTTRARLAVEAHGAEGVPGTVFVKLTPLGRLQRVFGIAARLAEMEVRFYCELAKDVPVRVPEVHAVAAGRGARRFVLVLEDVAATGAAFVEVGAHTTPERARAVVDGLAALHAAFWESPRFAGDLAWLRSLETRGRDLPLERFLAEQMLAAAARRHGRELPDTFHAARRVVVGRRDALEREWARGPRTLVHGDCHVGNLFFELAGRGAARGAADGMEERAGFLDWQVLARAPGVRDLAYFLCSSLSTGVRRAHQHELVARYAEALRAHGGPATHADEVFEGVRRFALYAWLAAAFTAGAGSGLQSERIARAGLERAHRALEDLDALAFLAGRGIG